MRKTAKDRRPNLRPPKRIEVNEGNTRVRVILLIVCIAIAIASFAYGINAFLKGSDRKGFTEIEVSGTDSVADELRFYYQLGDEGGSALYRELSAFWKLACERAHKIFSSEELFSDVGNLAALSKNPGETVTLDPALYRALLCLEERGVRTHYLAPIELHYRSVFYSESDFEASYYDISKNPELSDYYSALAAFARDPNAVSVELLGDNRARLVLSSAYRDFAAENEITAFVSLGYLKNAFVVDYLAETLAEAGYTEGTLSSIDGFTRHLDTDSGRDYSFNLFCREGNGIDLAAKLEGGDLKALISLRSYPLSGEDLDRFYLFADGSTLTSYLDTRDGASRVSTDNLVLYGGESCVELLLQAIPLWVADALSASDLVSLDLEAIWCEDGEIRCTDPSAPIFDLDEKYVKVDLTSGR